MWQCSGFYRFVMFKECFYIFWDQQTDEVKLFIFLIYASGKERVVSLSIREIWNNWKINLKKIGLLDLIWSKIMNHLDETETNKSAYAEPSCSGIKQQMLNLYLDFLFFFFFFNWGQSGHFWFPHHSWLPYFVYQLVELHVTTKCTGT